jgi:hypothetical protein
LGIRYDRNLDGIETKFRCDRRTRIHNFVIDQVERFAARISTMSELGVFSPCSGIATKCYLSVLPAFFGMCEMEARSPRGGWRACFVRSRQSQEVVGQFTVYQQKR